MHEAMTFIEYLVYVRMDALIAATFGIIAVIAVNIIFNQMDNLK
jgi:hypothetical protein